MKNPIRSTLEYYNKKGRSFFLRTIGTDMTADYSLFLQYLPEKGSILDAGCGSGRDSRYFIEKGYDVFSCDASEEMVKLSSDYLGKKTHLLALEDLDFDEKFDGVWCSATLLHLPPEKQRPALENLIHSLKPSGVMYFSYKFGSSSQSVDGRYFLNMNEDSIKELISPFNNITIKEMRKRPSFSSETTIWLITIIQKIT